MTDDRFPIGHAFRIGDREFIVTGHYLPLGELNHIGYQVKGSAGEKYEMTHTYICETAYIDKKGDA